jgi:predicted transcriptional regulator
MQSQDNDETDYVGLAADIVSAYVGHNRLAPNELPGIILAVHSALQGLNTPALPAPEKLEPRVSIRKSITPDFLISLEDGKQYRSLKRHLATVGLTPDQYRSKWGLPRDYPMVAPSYSKQRSELAKSLGLGQLRRKAPKETRDAVSSSEAPTPKARRGRPKKAEAAE